MAVVLTPLTVPSAMVVDAGYGCSRGSSSVTFPRRRSMRASSSGGGTAGIVGSMISEKMGDLIMLNGC